MTHARRAALQALAPRLLSAAGELTPNRDQAFSLVQEVLNLAEREPIKPTNLRSTMFRMLRQRVGLPGPTAGPETGSA
ncbi:MAG: hypothetical protein ABW042_05625 [Phenylobacterium sp.]